MSQSLAGAITALQTAVGAIDGIKQAPGVPPEKLSQFPFAVAYPGTGRIVMQPTGWYQAFHTIVLELHLARKDLPRDIAAALPYVELIPAVINANRTLGGAVTTIDGDISYQFAQLDWVGDIQTIGFRFEFEVRINHEL